jgi:DNA-binding transcriptional LysR family regulator
VAELTACPLVLPPPHYTLRQMVSSVERSENLQLTPAFVSESVTARKKIAAAGHGGALLSALAAQQEIQAGQLIPIEINHPAFTAMEACLIGRRGRILSPAVNQLLRLMQAHCSLFSSTQPGRSQPHKRGSAHVQP